MFNEDSLEKTCINWFEEIGYISLHGPDVSPNGDYTRREDYKEVVFKETLRDALIQINSEIPIDAIDEVIREIMIHNSPSLIENNQKFHQYITEGITIEYPREDGTIKTDKVWVFDKENIDNNIFEVVDQLTIIEGETQKRTDLIVYINGLPIAVFELKSATEEKATLQKSFNQIQTYKNSISSLFNYNELNIITDGVNARVGTITSNIERYMPWRSVDGEKLSSREIPQLEVTIKGIFKKERIIEILHNFILFQTDGSNITKIFSAYHQFFAVKKAVDATELAISDKGDQRIGVVWHTQGSGKSLSMVFYTGKLMLGLNNPTIVVITDRIDLDDQLYQTFSRSEKLIREKPKKAEDREDLKEILSVDSGGIIFTTIQKFEENEDPVLTDRKNVIVIADEAHRSQYGFIADMKMDENKVETKYGYAKYMRDALPNASYIGFTGTPIDIDDKNTRAVFGEYIDVYDMSQAVDDGMTVKIYYESKIVQIDIPEKEKNKLDEEIEKVTKGISEETKESFKSKYSRLQEVVAADDRIKTVANEIVNHFEKRQEAIFGKGMIVTISRQAAVKLYDEITNINPTWHNENDNKGNIKVVMSGSSDDPQNYQQHIRSKSQKKVVERRMKDPDDNLKLVIVCDMWLTGFDVPSLHTIYIDKPLKGHNLMQAIARVNRVYKDKPGGLIVDFIGIADSLKKALVNYTETDRKTTAVDYEKLISKLYEEYEIIQTILHGFDYNQFFTAKSTEKMSIITKTMDYILSKDEKENSSNKDEDSKEKRFIKHVNLISKLYGLCSTHPKAQEISEEIAFFKAAKSTIVKYFSEDSKSPQQVEGAINQMVSKAIAADGVIDIFEGSGIDPDMSILSDDFLEEVRKLQEKNVAVRTLEKILKTKVKVLSKNNLVKSEKFSEKLDKTLKSYNNRAVETKHIIEELIKLAEEMNKAQKEENDLGLSDDEIAFYDALGNNKSAKELMEDEVLIQIASELADVIRNSITIDWTERESVQAKMRVKIKRLLKKYEYPPDEAKKAVKTIMKQAELMSIKEVEKIN